MEPPDEEICYYSQFGQDHWLVNQAFPGRREGFFVDVGAFQMANGYMSNTLALELHRNWTGILVEPNPALCGSLEARNAKLVQSVVSDSRRRLHFQFGDRGCNSKVVADGGAEVPAETLTDILRREGAPSDIELLCIDVEGHEPQVLDGIDFDLYRFDCIIVEANGVQDAIVERLESHGYRFIEHHRVDLYFARKGFEVHRPSEAIPDWDGKPNRARPVPSPGKQALRHPSSPPWSTPIHRSIPT